MFIAEGSGLVGATPPVTVERARTRYGPCPADAGRGVDPRVGHPQGNLNSKLILIAE
ncbi:hypothetical protein [Sphingobium sp.]|uniref:hypothetical protein n=1 Tax=Sphingobium sp. TaxID=1912891 RepID=UPI0028BD3CED|nr:hypothetical protein [Sphingobium sp.]